MIRTECSNGGKPSKHPAFDGRLAANINVRIIRIFSLKRFSLNFCYHSLDLFLLEEQNILYLFLRGYAKRARRGGTPLLTQILVAISPCLLRDAP
jgi:hypothetical protein